MKSIIANKAIARFMSFLLTFSLMLCQLPTYAWAADSVSDSYVSDSVDDNAADTDSDTDSVADTDSDTDDEAADNTDENADGNTGENSDDTDAVTEEGNVTKDGDIDNNSNYEDSENSENSENIANSENSENNDSEDSENSETGNTNESDENSDENSGINSDENSDENSNVTDVPVADEENNSEENSDENSESAPAAPVTPEIPAVDVVVLTQMLDELPDVADYLAMTTEKQTEVKMQITTITSLLEQVDEDTLLTLDLARLMALNNYQTDSQRMLLAAAQPLNLTGEGTSDSPYIINTAADLKKLADDVNSGNTGAGKYFSLTADITLDGTWTPVGTISAPFAGNFSGNGHIVSGLNINSTENYQALFGYMNGGTISDLTVSGTVSGSGQYMAGIVAYVAGGSITGSTNNVAVTSTYANSLACVGGVAGYNMGIITDCSNTAAISAEKSYVGGIVGNNLGKVSDVENSGAISGRNRIGGIAGSSTGIEQALNTGNVTAANEYAGGIVGACAQDAVLSHVNVANCKVSGVDYVGSICGSGTVEWSFVDSVTLPDPEVSYQGLVGDGTTANVYEKSDSLTVDYKLLRSFLTENDTVDSNGYWTISDGSLKLDAENSKMVYKSKFIDETDGKVAKLSFKIDGTDVPETAVESNSVYAPAGSKLTVTPIAAVVEETPADISGLKFGGTDVVANTDGTWQITVNADASYEYGFGNLRSEVAAERYGWYLNDTSATDFHITNATEFAGFGEITRGEAVNLDGSALAKYAFGSKKIYIDADIDLSTICSADLGSWQPITASSAKIYGNGHTISGLYIDTTATASNTYIGLFGNINLVDGLTVDGTIKVTDKGSSLIGGIAGRASTVSNCINEVNLDVTVELSGNYSYIGGLVGKFFGGTVDTCMNTGDITVKGTSGTVAVGGVVGCGYGNWGYYNTIKNSLSSGKIKITEDSAATLYIGGIFGYKQSTSGTWTVDGNIFTGTIEIPESVTKATVGPIFNNTPVNNSYYLDGTPNTGSFGGTAKTAAEFNDIAFIYELDGGNGVWGIKDSMPAFISAGAEKIESVTVKNFAPTTYTLSFTRDGEGVAPVYQTDLNRVLTLPGTLKVSVTPAENFKLLVGGTEVAAETDGTYKVAVAADSSVMIECGDAAALEAATNVTANLGWYTEHSSDTTLYIGTPIELESLAALVNGKASGYAATSLSGKTIELTADIDLSTYTTWEPIGSLNTPFAGSFKGAGHSITGVKVDNATKDYQGLFGYISGDVENIKVSGSVTGHDYVGLLAGYIGGTVNDVEVSTVAVTGNDRVGGIAGYVGGYASCANMTAVSGTVTGHDYVGGLIGERTPLNGSTYNKYANAILYSAVMADVTVSGNDSVGGIVGTSIVSGLSSSYGNVRDSYSLAAVSASAEGAKVGGVAGDVTRVLSSFYYKDGATIPAIGSGAAKNVYYLTSDGVKIGAGDDTPLVAAAFSGREAAWGLDTPNGSHNDLWQTGTPYPVFGANTVDEEGNTVAYNGENNVYKVTLTNAEAVTLDVTGTDFAVTTDTENKTQTVYMLAGEKINLKYAAPADKTDCKPYFDTEAIVANADGTYTLAIEKSDYDYQIGYTLMKPAESATKWYTDNTESDVFVISNLDDLWGFANLVNGNVAGQSAKTFEGKTVKLADDLKDGKIIIPLAQAGEDTWSGIGKSATKSFKGTFDGNGKTIEYHFNDETATDVSLFAYLGDGATVKNLTVEGDITAKSLAAGVAVNAGKNVTFDNCINKVKIVCSYGYTTSKTPYASAGIVAIADSGVTINNCHNQAEIAANAGIIGLIKTEADTVSTIKNSTNTADINAGMTVGGILNTVTGDGKLVLENLSNTGALSAKAVYSWGESWNGVGGIMYQNSDFSGELEAKNLTNSGNITGGSYLGGIIGYFSGTTAVFNGENLVNTGTVEAKALTSYAGVGGIFGYEYCKCNISRSYNSGNITAAGSSSYVSLGGIIGTIYSRMTSTTVLNDCYNIGDVEYTGTSSIGIGGLVGTYGLRAGSTVTVNDSFNYGKLATKKVYGFGAIANVTTANCLIMNNCYAIDDMSYYQLNGKDATISDSGKYTPVKAADFATYQAALNLNNQKTDAVFTYNFGDAHPTFAAEPFDASGSAVIVNNAKLKIAGAADGAAYGYFGRGEAVSVTITPAENELISGYTVTDTDSNAYPYKATEADGVITLNFTMPAKTLLVKADFITKPEEAKEDITVTFNANGGKWTDGDTKTATLAYGSRMTSANLPDSPTKDGETFMGWYTDAACTSAYNMNTMLTESITLYARFADAVTVTYVFENASMQLTDGDHQDEAKVLIAKGDALGAPDIDPERSGYSFFGWYSDAEFLHSYEFDKPVKQDTTIYASFVKDGMAAVQFDLNGGMYDGKDYITRQDITVGEKAVEPDKTKMVHPDGYPFAGWFTDKYDEATKYDFASEVNASTTLYAHWQGDTYKIEEGGTEENPYIIESLEQLMALRDAVNAGNHFTKQYFKLSADITLPSGWKSIGVPQSSNKVTKYFAGVFDGDDHTITYQKGAETLFGAAGGYDQWMDNTREDGMCTIKNLKLEGDVIGAGLVNSPAQTLWISNITLLSGSTTTDSGLLGDDVVLGTTYNYKFLIDDCKVEAGCTIGTGIGQPVGGIATHIYRGEINRCTFLGDVSGSKYVGGIVGQMSGGGYQVAIDKCYVGGSVSGNTYVGGITGGGGLASMCYTQSGIWGITDCICMADVSGSDIVGGIVGSTSDMSSVFSPNIKSVYFGGTIKCDGYFSGPILGRMQVDPKGYVVSGSSPWDMLGNTSALLYKTDSSVADGATTIKWDYKNGATAADVVQNENEHVFAVTPELAGTGYEIYMLEGADGVHRGFWSYTDGEIGMAEEDGAVTSVYKAEYKIENGEATVTMQGMKQNAEGSNVVYSLAGNTVSLDIKTSYYAEPEVTQDGTTYFVNTVDSVKLDYVTKSYENPDNPDTSAVIETPASEDLTVESTERTAYAASFTMPDGDAVITITLGQDEIFVPVEPKDDSSDDDDDNGKGNGNTNGNGSGIVSGDGIGSGEGEGQGSGTGDGYGKTDGEGSAIGTPGGSENNNGKPAISVTPVPDTTVDRPAQVITPVDDVTDPAETETDNTVDTPTPDAVAEGGSAGGEGGDNSEDNTGDEEEVQMTLFEVIRTTLVENPIVTAVVTAMVAFIIVAAGFNRYRRNRK